MWQDLIDQKEKWIGGKLIDQGIPVDRGKYPDGECPYPITTKIIDLGLTDYIFYVCGRDFDFKGARDILGISSTKVENGLSFFGYGGHRFDIVRPVAEEESEADRLKRESGGIP